MCVEGEREILQEVRGDSSSVPVFTWLCYVDVFSHKMAQMAQCKSQEQAVEAAMLAIMLSMFVIYRAVKENNDGR